MKIKLCFILFAFNFWAQDTLPQRDSILLEYHQKSMLYSALVPGLGQIRNSIDAPRHNHAIWKVPLIYSALGASGYFLYTNQQTQLSLKQEYTNRKEGGILVLN